MSQNTRTKTVLIADDDFDLARSLGIRLQQLGLSVMRSPDASHALFGVHKIQPNLIIMDVDMPGGNGLAVCEMLASDPAYMDTPVIVHTGFSDARTIERCRELGVHYVLKSPRAWEQIKAIVCKELKIKVKAAAAAAGAAGG